VILMKITLISYMDSLVVKISTKISRNKIILVTTVIPFYKKTKKIKKHSTKVTNKKNDDHSSSLSMALSSEEA
jgi:hypothetical protein